MSHRERLICFADSFEMNLLAVPFLLPLPNCLLRVCLATLFAAVLNFFLPLTTSAIAGTANSNKSAPTHVTAGTIYLCKMELQFSQYFVQVHRIPVHVVDQYLYRMELYLPWSNDLVTTFRLEINVGGFLNIKTRRVIPTDKKGIFHRSCLSSQCEYYGMNFWAAVWFAGCWMSDSSCTVL